MRDRWYPMCSHASVSSLVVWRADLDMVCAERDVFPALVWLFLVLISLSRRFCTFSTLISSVIHVTAHQKLYLHPWKCVLTTWNSTQTKVKCEKSLSDIFSCPLCFNLGLVLISTSFLPFFNPPFIFCWCVGTVKCVGHPSVNFPVCLTPSLRALCKQFPLLLHKIHKNSLNSPVCHAN